MQMQHHIFSGHDFHMQFAVKKCTLLTSVFSEVLAPFFGVFGICDFGTRIDMAHKRRCMLEISMRI